jgi:hypothetical protein
MSRPMSRPRCTEAGRTAPERPALSALPPPDSPSPVLLRGPAVEPGRDLPADKGPHKVGRRQLLQAGSGLAVLLLHRPARVRRLSPRRPEPVVAPEKALRRPAAGAVFNCTARCAAGGAATAATDLRHRIAGSESKV